MANASNEPKSESLPTGVFELPGEPAIVINGVPELLLSDSSSPVLSSAANGTELQGNASPEAEFLGNTGFGEWLEGREVRKLFEGRYYIGIVTQFDKQNGWYRVLYKDGDSEDLDWLELQEILLPLDISVPLKSLALKIIKKSQKNVHKPGKSVTKSQIGKTGST